MRLDDTEESQNTVDRRSEGGGMHPAIKLGGGGGVMAIVIMLVAMYMGVDPRALLNGNPAVMTGGNGDGTGGAAPQVQVDPAEEPLRTFVAKVLKTTEDVWTREFQQIGKTYQKPKLTFFSGSIQSACGGATAAVGPFYCPGDQIVYIDLSFYRQLAKDLNSPGDFAQAYVIAHEVGHHIQKQLGTSDKVDAARRQLSEAEFNRLSVRLELQADFYAGVWAHYMQQKLEPGDIEEALNAANHIGDDALQKRGQGYVVPDSFTHGTSAQRVKWFRKGYTSGDINQGDTFKVSDQDL